jgi:hypothetical protein
LQGLKTNFFLSASLTAKLSIQDFTDKVKDSASIHLHAGTTTIIKQ